jgi:pimeloyl-ACP methyl ester carboxylesterase
MIVDTPRGSFSCFSHGEGPLVLFLHGFPDSPHAFVPVMERVTGYRCVAPFLRGYAPSVLEGPYDIDTLAADVRALGDALSPSAPYAIVGHDWGAMIGYLAAGPRTSALVTMSVPHPSSFARALLVDPAQLRRSWYMAFFQTPFAERIVKRDDFAFIDRLFRAWSPSLTADTRNMKDALRPGFPAALEYYRAMPRHLRRRWPRIATPTLYMVGRQDGCIGADVGRDQHRYFDGPFAREIVEGAGHFLQWEKPELIADRVASFLTHSERTERADDRAQRGNDYGERR